MDVVTTILSYNTLKNLVMLLIMFCSILLFLLTIILKNKTQDEEYKDEILEKLENLDNNMNKVNTKIEIMLNLLSLAKHENVLKRGINDDY